MEVLGPGLGKAKETRRSPASTESLSGQVLFILLCLALLPFPTWGVGDCGRSWGLPRSKGWVEV